MNGFSPQFKNSFKKAASWTLAALTALTCAATIPALTSPTVKAEAYSVDLSNEERGVIYANSRTDFRDESIYFVMTTRFYNGDTSNDVQCWEAIRSQVHTNQATMQMTRLGEAISRVLSRGLTISRHSALQQYGSLL